MAQDTFTEVTNESWFSRLGGAIKGVLLGIVLVIAGIGVLFWNEGRAVHRAQDLEAGAGALVEVSAATVDTANDGRLVHLAGEAVTDETLRDDDFDVTAPALRLRRQVEMHQWIEDARRETRKKVGGGTETKTTYSYRKAWTDDLVDSAEFGQSEGHENPDAMPYRAATTSAGTVTVGAFRLPDALVAQLDGFRPLDPPAPDGGPALASGGALYLSADRARTPDPVAPQIGDTRLTWSVVAPGPVSVLGVQRGATLESWRGPSGSTVFVARAGTHSGDAMFGQLESQNRTMLWLFRAGGALAVYIGLGLLFAPLGVLADVLPPVGSLVRLGTGTVTFLLGTILSLATVSVGWIFYRPLIGIPLLLGAVGAVVGLIVLIRRKGEEPPAALPAPALGTDADRTAA